MRVVCAPDKLRGALDGPAAAAALARGVQAAGGRPVVHPMADGGEGSRATVQAACGGATWRVPAADAAGVPTEAPVGLLDDGTALVEAAEVIGWGTSPEVRQDVMRASSTGLAAPLTAAVDRGARRVVVFLGGTVTMDGGAGLLAALGADLLDRDGRRWDGTPAGLRDLASVQLSAARARLAGVELVAAADVRSPLAGPTGSAHLFGPQKGATGAQVAVLDDGLRRLGHVLGLDPAAEGAGAAGGIGAALLALGARVELGATIVRQLTGLDEVLTDADLCLTAEGKVDAGSGAGKTVSAVVDACRLATVPCVVLGGTLTPDAGRLYERGASAVLPIGSGPTDLETALQAAAADLSRTAYAMTRLAADVRAARAHVVVPS